MNLIDLNVETTKNEPQMHSLVSDSFIIPPSVGMRLAPELLVLELYREIFFETRYGEPPSNVYLDPNQKIDKDIEFFYSKEERATLHAMKGRRKKSKQSIEQHFFAPVYPVLARNAWLRKQSERLVHKLLFSGPIAQHLWYEGETVQEKKKQHEDFVRLATNAVAGHNYNPSDGSCERQDILAATLIKVDFKLDLELAKSNLLQLTLPGSTLFTYNGPEDNLSLYIFNDFKAICQLEKHIPRSSWLLILMSYLRFSLPIWMIAQMKITTMLYNWLIDSIEKRRIPAENEIINSVLNRNRCLLTPTLTPTREVFDITSEYMKQRVGLNIILYMIEKVKPGVFDGKNLTLCKSGKTEMSIFDLISISADGSDKLKQLGKSNSIQSMLIRCVERFPAWKDPLNKGQGKNIDEFFRVMYRAEAGDENGSYLLQSVGRGVSRGFRIFPGHMLMQTVTYLAAKKKGKNGGKLILEDVENHFRHYGIDFSFAAEARPLFMKKLKEMGLLVGSPDAGSSVTVHCPYIV